MDGYCEKYRQRVQNKMMSLAGMMVSMFSYKDLKIGKLVHRVPLLSDVIAETHSE